MTREKRGSAGCHIPESVGATLKAWPNSLLQLRLTEAVRGKQVDRDKTRGKAVLCGKGKKMSSPEPAAQFIELRTERENGTGWVK